MHRVLNALTRLVWLAGLLALLAAAGCNLDYAGIPTPVALASGAPVVTIASPLPDSVFLPGVDVIIQSRITNAGPGIARVEMAVDGATVLSLDDPNPSGAYAFSAQTRWEATGPGPHTLTIAAVREDGTRSLPATLTFRVAGAESTTSPTPAVTATVGVPILPTQPPSSTPPPASPAATTANTGGGPLSGTFIQTLNVRSGPGLVFNPPIGILTAGQTADVLARNPAGDWLKVRYLDGEGWVFAQLVTLNGDAATLPVDSGPPAPTQAVAPQALPAPATNTPQTTANLAGGVITLNPSQPVCAQTFVVSLDVANLGAMPTAASGTVALVNTRAADGSIQQETTGGFPILQPGETFRVDMPLTVSTFYDEPHRLTLTIDPGNQIAETQDGDNVVTVEYVLLKGACP